MKKLVDLTTNELMRIAYENAMEIQYMNHNMFNTEEIVGGIEHIIYLLTVGENEEIETFKECQEGLITNELLELLNQRQEDKIYIREI